jgi:hypothetical protein
VAETREDAALRADSAALPADLAVLPAAPAADIAVRAVRLTARLSSSPLRSACLRLRVAAAFFAAAERYAFVCCAM